MVWAPSLLLLVVAVEVAVDCHWATTEELVVALAAAFQTMMELALPAALAVEPVVGVLKVAVLISMVVTFWSEHSPLWWCPSAWAGHYPGTRAGKFQTQYSTALAFVVEDRRPPSSARLCTLVGCRQRRRPRHLGIG